MNKEEKWALQISSIQELIDDTKKLIKEKQNLIKYLEDKIEEYEFCNKLTSATRVIVYQEILDKIKEGNYE